MRDRFHFLRSYADVIFKVAEADQQLAKDLAYKIIDYWINGTTQDSGNPILEGLFVQIKIMLDKGLAISDANTANWKMGWRPKKDWENLQKPKQNPNESEAKAKKSKRENIKEEKSNNILSDITAVKTAAVYWDKDVNKCLDLISSYNGGLIDGTKQNQRRYAKLLVDKLNKLDSIKEGKFTWYDTLEIILKVISKNKYYASKITSPENIFRNLSVLMQQCKADIGKANSSQKVLQQI